MIREIGSDFEIGFELFFNSKRNNILRNSILLTSGRDCIDYIIKDLGLNKDSYILLPSYFCDSILDPLKKWGLDCGFYKIDKNLNVDIVDLKKKVLKKKPKFVLVIHYFGFIQPEINKIKEICEKNEIKLVEDYVQSFLSGYPFVGDYVFNSYRKFLPLPDGAFLLGNFNKRVKVNHTKTDFVSNRLIGGLLKNFIFLKKHYRKFFVEAEDRSIDSYDRPVAMSGISKFLLNRIDLREIIFKRRRNYLYLVNKLKTMKNVKVLFPKISKNVCPLGCPIIVKDRDKIRKFLIQNKIYPSIHWILPKDVSKEEFSESWDVSDNILTIPIDQRYNLRDMYRIVGVINGLH
ncbi:MAG: DegT/DnrJ/EryC1/StrS family aminotransferase [Candidatus Woesearchaeota archaeon]